MNSFYIYTTIKKLLWIFSSYLYHTKCNKFNYEHTLQRQHDSAFTRRIERSSVINNSIKTTSFYIRNGIGKKSIGFVKVGTIQLKKNDFFKC